MTVVKLLKLSLRNLRRNSRRSLITILVSSAGFAALSIFAGYMEFTFYGLREATICKGFTSSSGLGHLQVIRKESLSNSESYPFEYGLEKYDKLQNELEKQKYVYRAIPRIEFGGIVSNGEKSVSFLGEGIDPVKESGFIEYWNSLRYMVKEMTMSDSLYVNLQQKKPFSVIIGEGMAKVLNAKEGASLMLISTTVDGAVNVVDVIVSGIVKNNLKAVDEHFLVTHLELVQDLIQTDKVSKMILLLDDTERTAQVRERLSNVKIFDSYVFMPWDKLAAYYKGVSDVYDVIFGFTGLVVIFIVFLSSANTMLMATMERVKEIGTMKAIGIKDHFISIIFLFEGFFLGLMSLLVGFFIKELFSFLVNTMRIKMPPPPGISMNYIMQIFPAYSYMPLIGGLVLVITTLSALVALARIKKITIVESLVYV